MAKVQIMISTYNGAAYVREQLKSILRLSNADDVSVLIRDDGSTDDTPSILAEYAEEYGFRVIYGENVGLNASLQMLIVLCLHQIMMRIHGQEPSLREWAMLQR